MNMITNKKGEALNFGDSPHIIVVTADSHIIQTVEPVISGQQKDYLLDDRKEGGTLFSQE